MTLPPPLGDASSRPLSAPLSELQHSALHNAQVECFVECRERFVRCVLRLCFLLVFPKPTYPGVWRAELLRVDNCKNRYQSNANIIASKAGILSSRYCDSSPRELHRPEHEIQMIDVAFVKTNSTTSLPVVVIVAPTVRRKQNTTSITTMFTTRNER